MFKLRLTPRLLKIGLLSGFAIAAGLVTANQPRWLDGLEYRLQSGFFESRGPVSPPDNIVILAIDDASLGQGASYQSDPTYFADLAAIQTWPWRRQAYAKVIERLMQAGAKAVALDILFTTPSAYGQADDQAFRRVLKKYGDRVVLASKYANTDNLQGRVVQYVEPIPLLLNNAKTRTGFINLPIEADGQIHHLGRRISQAFQQQADFREMFPKQAPMSFATATLKAAQPSVSSRRSSQQQSTYINFYGPDRTFPQYSFWNVLDSNSWQTSLNQGEPFRGKIVLIGSTAPSQQDQQPAPFANSWRYTAPLYGVEVQAAAIATLQEQAMLQDLLLQPWLRGGWVIICVVLGGAGLIARKPPVQQILLLMLGLGCLSGGTYGLFVGGQRVVPIAAPLLALTSGGIACIVTELAYRQRQTQQLRDTLKSHLTVPLVQAIVDQQDDLRDLLKERERVVRGKILGGRYEVSRLIGSGGFGETYLALDLQRPGEPECVVKQLKYQTLQSQAPQSQTAKSAKRLFLKEAEALEKLGHHEQIPQLLAYFEEMDEFYLVQELVPGMSLSHELDITKRLPISHVLHLLQDVLEVLAFIHTQKLIHRDIKPSNLMHRNPDGRWVLIDFGIVKQFEASANDMQRTMAVGTLGYVAPEQALGHPTCASDLYALGMTAIEALTGMPAPELLELELSVRLAAAPPLSPEMSGFLMRLTESQEVKRFSSATDALAGLKQLPEMATMIDAPVSIQQIGQLRHGMSQLHDWKNDAMPQSEHELQTTTLIFDSDNLTEATHQLNRELEN